MRIPLPKRRPLRWGVYCIAAVVFILAILQALPYGRDHSNPPVTAEPAWDSPRTRELAARACFDCHSNLTKWYWYTNVAPFSWLAQRDVDGGRSALNFSQWDRPQEEAGDLTEAVLEGSMPPWIYKVPHPAARLSAQERQELTNGLAAIAGTAPGGGREGDDD